VTRKSQPQLALHARRTRASSHLSDLVGDLDVDVTASGWQAMATVVALLAAVVIVTALLR
jgi:hypothetical protein